MFQSRIKALAVTHSYAAVQAFTVCDSESKNPLSHISILHPVLTPEQLGPLPRAHWIRRPTVAFLWPCPPQQHEESVGSLKSMLPIAPPVDHAPRTWEAAVPSQASLSRLPIPA